MKDYWKHITNKSDEELEEWVKIQCFDYLFDKYHCMFSLWNNFKSQLYTYRDLEEKVKNIGGSIVWSNNNSEHIKELEEFINKYERTLNKINEFARKHHKK